MRIRFLARALALLAGFTFVLSFAGPGVIPASADEGESAPHLRQPKPAPAARPPIQIRSAGPAPTVFSRIFPPGSGAKGSAFPGDPCVAVGPKYMIVTSNGSDPRYTYRDGSYCTASCPSPWAGGPTVVDQRVIYDAATSRFFVIASDYTNGVSYTDVGVSKSSDPLADGWWSYRFSNMQTVGGTNYWADYPSIGVDHQCLYVTLNMFPQYFAGSLYDVEILAMDKSALESGTLTYTTTYSTSCTSPGLSYAFTLAPASQAGSGSAGNVGYFAEMPFDDASHLRVWALSDPLGTPSLSVSSVSIPSNGGGFGGTGAPQGGTSKVLDTVSPRAMSNAYWRQGELWFGCTAGASFTSPHAIVFFYDVATLGFPSGAPMLATSGAIDGGSGVWNYMPAMVVDSTGDVCMTFTQSSSTTTPTCMATVMKAGYDAFPPPSIVTTSFTYSHASGGFGRWGDYAGAAIDPFDGSFWVVNQVATGDTDGWTLCGANLVLPDSGVTWVPDGEEVRRSYTHVEQANVAADGAGGAYVAWLDSRIGAPRVYAARIGPSGAPASGWPTGGTQVSDADATSGGELSTVSDGHGSVYVLFEGIDGIVLQNVTSSGAIGSGWPTSGVGVSDAVQGQVVADTAGAAVVTWVDASGNAYVQKYSGNGTAQWTSGGVLVGTGAEESAITSDGTGGTIVAWAPSLHAQRLSGSGTIQWPSGGVAVNATAYGPILCRDGSGGAIVAYSKDLGTSQPVYAVRIDSGGSIPAGWGAGGNACTANPANQLEPSIDADGSGGAIVSWTQGNDIIAQRLTSAGAVASGWSSNGFPVCTAPGTQQRARCVGDGGGGALVTWNDIRGIYCQHVLASGSQDAAFTTDGNPICTAAGAQKDPTIGVASPGVAFLVWADGRSCGSGSCTTAIDAQRQVFANGPVAVGPPTAGPRDFVLEPSRPNPFTRSTSIGYAIARRAHVRIAIFDPMGRVVRTLVDGDRNPGRWSVDWDGRSDHGERVNPGVYLYRMSGPFPAIERRLVSVP